MAEIDEIRNELIGKILTIRNSNVLLEIDDLISSKDIDSDFSYFTEEQEIMLKMSEKDIVNGKTIPHNLLMENTTKWLTQKKNT